MSEPNNHYLLAVSIGPVQGFIAAARRTRDLWFGSYMLSNISRATAKAISDSGATLIFPSSESIADGHQANVANLIVAEAPEDFTSGQVEELINKAKKEAIDKWSDYAGAALAFGNAGDGELIDEKRWYQQVADVLEIYAAFIPWRLGESYSERRRRLILVLAGRKALRDFSNAEGQAKIAKSSLDGARESVLVHKNRRVETRKKRHELLTQNPKLAQRLRLSNNEELDAVGFTKRASKDETFPSVVRVAADPWIRGLNDEARKVLETIRKSCEAHGFASGGGDKYRQLYSQFPFDGGVLFPSRIQSMLRKSTEGDDYSFDNTLSEQERHALKEVRDSIEKIQSRHSGLGFGEPQPYYAILVADGDRMGATISNISEIEDHRRFSSDLARFAKVADDIVAEHHGCLVYAGGDDVLAFLPLDRCLECAGKLYAEFSEQLSAWPDKEGRIPTLSIGVAIGHSMEPLADMLEYGRAAEKEAKDGAGSEREKRNALAIHFHARSGSPVRVRDQWSPGVAGMLNVRVMEWARLHAEGLIPDKLAYDLRSLAVIYETWPSKTELDKSALAEAIQYDSLRLIKKKQHGMSEDAKQKITALLKEADCAMRTRRVADEIIIARRVAVALTQARASENMMKKESADV